MLVNSSAATAGLAVAKLEGETQEFKVVAFGLPPFAPVEVIVDAVALGTFVTESAGQLQLDFSTAARHGALPLPEITGPLTGVLSVQIRDAVGTLLASGEFSQLSNAPRAVGHVRRHLGGRR